ncbi:hypothetical protein [Streptomyces sp. NPDC006879]|uniref:hypothetical protein n=1 Tax=Streptomyces sp. NPDC006879 TaxID=3364767 RepID=UPI0036CD999B
MPFRTSRSRRWPIALFSLTAFGAVGALAVFLLSGSDRSASRPVTTTEAQQLALVRFNLHDAGTVRVALTLPSADGMTTVVGLVDYRTHHAVGRFTTDTGSGRRSSLLAWDGSGLAVASSGKEEAEKYHDDAVQLARAAAAVNPRAWSARAHTSNPLDVALRLVIGLGHDRPDNAQLLAQSGPRRLGEETIKGVDYTIFSGPRPRPTAAPQVGTAVRGAVPSGRSPLTYWVDTAGRLGRLEAQLASLDRPARWELAPAPRGAKVPSEPFGSQ